MFLLLYVYVLGVTLNTRQFEGLMGGVESWQRCYETRYGGAKYLILHRHTGSLPIG